MVSRSAAGSRKQASAGDSTFRSGWNPCRARQRNGLLCFVCTGNSVPSQGKPDDPFQRALIEDTLPVCRFPPSQSVRGTQAHSGSSRGIAGQVREVGGTKLAFLFFPLALRQCYVEAQLMCSFALVLSVQCTGSCMIYTHTQHVCACFVLLP